MREDARSLDYSSKESLKIRGSASFSEWKLRIMYGFIGIRVSQSQGYHSRAAIIRTIC